jgi:uncharacterized protein
MSEELSFESDGATLRGTLSLPDSSRAYPAVVVAHGSLGGSRDYFLYRHLAELLSECGVATFRFDRRGEGASGGASDASFTQLARDLSRATAAVAAHPCVDSRRVGLWGVSQGGWITVLSATQGSPIAALAIVSGTPVTPAQQMTHAVTEILTSCGYDDVVVKRALEVRAAVERFAKGELSAETVRPLLQEARREPWFKDAWIPSLEEADWTDMDLDILPFIAKLQVPTLLLFGEDDPWIPVEESVALWRGAAPCSLDLTIEIVAGVGHEMIAGNRLDIPTAGQPVDAYEEALGSWVLRVL